MSKFSAEDFIKLTNSTDKHETISLAKRIFDSVDTNNSGFIDQEEMLAMMVTFGQYLSKKNQQNISHHHIEEMAKQGIIEMDKNLDG